MASPPPGQKHIVVRSSRPQNQAVFRVMVGQREPAERLSDIDPLLAPSIEVQGVAPADGDPDLRVALFGISLFDRGCLPEMRNPASKIFANP